MATGLDVITAVTTPFTASGELDLPAEPAEVMAYYREIATAADGAQLYAYLYPERAGVGSPRPSSLPWRANAVSPAR